MRKSLLLKVLLIITILILCLISVLTTLQTISIYNSFFSIDKLNSVNSYTYIRILLNFLKILFGFILVVLLIALIKKMRVRKIYINISIPLFCVIIFIDNFLYISRIYNAGMLTLYFYGYDPSFTERIFRITLLSTFEIILITILVLINRQENQIFQDCRLKKITGFIKINE